MASFELTAQAEEDLIDIWLYIAQENPSAADRLLDEIEEKFSLLAANPELGPARPNIADDCRYFPVGNYLILYRLIPSGVQIVRIIQGARRLDNLFS